MKVLILGSKGMLGTDLVEVFKDEELYAYDIDEIDITDGAQVNDTIDEIRPECVINTAAYTDVDGAEDNKEVAFKVNAKAVEFIARACKKNGCVLVHISTDYVFDGLKKEGYNEDDIKNPINEYGYSKSKGEDYLIGVLDKYYLIRTSWLFGKNGKNFVNTILRIAKEKDELKVVNDQFGKPTYTKDLAKGIKSLFEKPFGIYHITNEGSCSWFDFAQEIVKLKKFETKVIPIKSDEMKKAAKRPNYSILINNKTEKLREWRLALKDYLEEIKNG